MNNQEGVHEVHSESQERGVESLPPQHHAGQVGYGPNYHPASEPTIQEKIKGLKEELEGKVKHNPELVRQGHNIRSGEEKRKKLTGEDEHNPFQSAKEDEAKSQA